jgi:acyl-CoA thioesterase FadM
VTNQDTYPTSVGGSGGGDIDPISQVAGSLMQMREYWASSTTFDMMFTDVDGNDDIWRLCQDAATLASIEAGWPPSRFRTEKVAFIVYRMTTVHEARPRYGTALDAQTWVSRLRRRTLCTREVRIRSAGALVAAATQEWVHVDFETLKPKQGSEDTAAAFPEADLGASVKMPAFEPRLGPEDHFSFQMWQTWADPLAHANHPAYVDWCDEATSRRMLGAGIDPVLLLPIAERVTFKNAVLPGEEVSVKTRRIGALGADAVALEHVLHTPRGVAAEAVTIRGLAETSGDSLISAWG